MKKTQNGFAVQWLILIFAVLVMSGVLYYFKSKNFQFSNNQPKVVGDINDQLEARKKATLEYKTLFDGLKKEFPDTIGNYKLYSEGPESISIREECVSGDVADECGRVVYASYRENNAKNIIFVRASLLGENNNVLENFKKNYSNYFTIGKYRVIRIEKHEIAWIADQTFDLIVTQEGQWSELKNGTNGISYSYAKTAQGDNAVTQYFLNKFPPKL